MTAATPIADEVAARLRRRQNSEHPELWSLLDRVRDPEIPVISIWDLGVDRKSVV